MDITDFYPGETPKDHPGLFITFEGGEGAGKSHQIHRVAEALSDAGHPILVTREPGGTEEGQALRALLVTGEGQAWEPMSELMLVTASRVQHITKLLKPALEMGKIVLCDRYIHSTLAYQGMGGGVDPDVIINLHNAATDNLWPDYTVILDIDPETGLKRSLKRIQGENSDEDRFEKKDLDFHQDVRNTFLALAEQRPERHFVVDTGVLDADGTFQAIMDDLRPKLAQRADRDDT